MSSPLEYDLGAVLFENASARVQKATSKGSGQPVILKILPSDQDSPTLRDRMQNEYAILSELNLPGVVKAIEFGETDQGLVLVEEDIGGVPLKNGISGGPCSLDEFFTIALSLAETIRQVHRQQIIHRDINPSHVVRNPTTGRLQLIDFGLASRLSREVPQLTAPSQLEGTLPYMAPEQTGRMNRMVDYRVDFYALGATFYELLTGHLPFTASDALEWVHCHIARQPRSPSELVPAIPKMLSAIVLKLMAKLAEDRYLSASGLIHDLEECRRQWKEHGTIAEFPLAAEDLSERFQLPQRLFGRETEVATLLAAFDRVALTSQPEIVLLAGYSGVGKSVLVAELHQPIVARRGYFISGKFDQFNRAVPYASLAAAFHSLIQQLLTEPRERIEQWRQHLLVALGENGQLMIDLVPQVELIIGPQPAVPDLPADQAQHRLHTVFQRFVSVFTAAQQPLVLFLDDLQWIDPGSLRLLEQLALSPHTRNLLILGAYRDNEVDAAHPLSELIVKLRRDYAALTTMTLAPLTEAHVTAMLTEALKCSPDHAALLAHLVHEKTRGNPFFCAQFLMALHQDGLLIYDDVKRRWCWDFAEIEARNFTDNVVKLMLGELERLPPLTQEALAFGGFLGNQFSLATLALVLERTIEATAEALWPALKAGLIVEHERRYRFLHDRVHEAAFALTPPAQRAAVHAHIGRLLRDHTAPDDFEENLFDFLGHLNLGLSQITDSGERFTLAGLNLRAGRKARLATVFSAAEEYFKTGLDLLTSDGWASAYPLMLALHLEYAQCACLNGHFPVAQELLETAANEARTPIDRASVALQKARLLMSEGRNAEACDVAEKSLCELGLDPPTHSTPEQLRKTYHEIKTLLGDRPIECIIDLPAVSDLVALIAMRLLSATSTAVYFTEQNLWAQLVAEMTLLSLKYGNADASVMVYTYYGFMLAASLHEYEEGIRFCAAAQELMKRRGENHHRGDLLFHQALTAVWVRPIPEVSALLDDAIPAAIENGNFIVAGLASYYATIHGLFKGEPMDEVLRRAEHCRYLSERSQFAIAEALCHPVREFCRFLKGEWGDITQPVNFLPEHDDATVANTFPIVLCSEDIMRLAAYYRAGRYEEARAAGRKAESRLSSVRGILLLFYYVFYDALALAAADHLDESDRQKLEDHAARLAEWAKSNPPVFGPYAALVTAEIARAAGRDADAMRDYNRAIESARQHTFVQMEALAHELAGRFYRQREAATSAEAHLRAAIAAYGRKGATAKAEQLQALYPEIRQEAPRPQANAPQLAMLAVVKATQAISGHIVRADLLRKLVEVLLEESGAQHAVLLLSQEEWFEVTAEARVVERRIEVQLPAPHAPSDSEVPVSVLHYIHRTHEIVLQEDTREPHPFSSDAYLVAQQPRTFLALPILRQNTLIGVLYLEHFAAANVFGVARFNVIEQLAAQAAISLENAQLYEQSTQQAERLKLLHGIDRAILAATSVEDICQAVFAQVGRLIPYRRVSVTLYETGGALRFASHGHGEVIPAEHVPGLEEIPGLFPTDTVATLDDIRLHSHRHPILQQIADSGVIGALSAPLTIDGQLRGRLNFSSDRPDAYTPAHVEIAGQIAAQLAIATHQRELHEQTRRHAIELEKRVAERTEELEKANKELETFAYSVSHDLRAPLRTIDGYTSMLAEDFMEVLGPEGQRQCKIIRAQASRMQQLIEDILTFSRLSRAPLRTETLDVTALVQKVFEEVTHTENRERIEFHLEPLPPALGDPSLLTQVWTNLLSNAVKYSSKVPRAIIHVDAVREGSENIYRVRDNGAGFDMAYADKLFGVFRRLHTEREFPGTGVGLAIVQRIVQRHGGRIWAESEPDKGATFFFTLPEATS